MPKTRPPYAPEFRRQMIELVRAGRDPDCVFRRIPAGDSDAKQPVIPTEASH